MTMAFGVLDESCSYYVVWMDSSLLIPPLEFIEQL